MKLTHSMLSILTAAAVSSASASEIPGRASTGGRVERPAPSPVKERRVVKETASKHAADCPDRPRREYVREDCRDHYRDWYSGVEFGIGVGPAYEAPAPVVVNSTPVEPVIVNSGEVNYVLSRNSPMIVVAAPAPAAPVAAAVKAPASDDIFSAARKNFRKARSSAWDARDAAGNAGRMDPGSPGFDNAREDAQKKIDQAQKDLDQARADADKVGGEAGELMKDYLKDVQADLDAARAALPPAR